MSVVTRRTRRHWVAVCVGVAALVGVPNAVSAAYDARSGSLARVPVAALIERVRASAAVQYTAQAESRGNLGLPDLPRLSDVAARLGGTTDTRVWWAGEDSWRVDVLTATGEQGTYDRHGRTMLWDFEANRRTAILGDASVRLPRAEDLLPPTAARRFLGGLGPADRVTALPGTQRVAGQTALGLRLVPGDRRSTIGRVDIWVRPADGLPLALQAVGTTGGTALDTRFTHLSPGPPAPTALQPPAAAGITTEIQDEPDIVGRLERFGRWKLPPSLAGLRATTPLVSGSGTYGPGLAKIVVLPVPPRLADQLIGAGADAGGKDLGIPGSSVLIRSGALSVAVVLAPGDLGSGWVVAGLVTPETVTAAGKALAADPPPQVQL